MERINNWYNELVSEGATDYEIAAGLQNGDIEKPEWLAFSPSTSAWFAIWDTAETDGSTALIVLDI